MLFHYPDTDFKQIVRMDKQSFVRIVQMIEGHAVFANNSRNEQAPCWIQTMVVLGRVGCDGNGASIGRNARHGGVSYGTVCMYTTRVFSAILSFHPELYFLPGQFLIADAGYGGLWFSEIKR